MTSLWIEFFVTLLDVCGFWKISCSQKAFPLAFLQTTVYVQQQTFYEKNHSISWSPFSFYRKPFFSAYHLLYFFLCWGSPLQHLLLSIETLRTRVHIGCGLAWMNLARAWVFGMTAASGSDAIYCSEDKLRIKASELECCQWCSYVWKLRQPTWHLPIWLCVDLDKPAEISCSNATTVLLFMCFESSRSLSNKVLIARTRSVCVPMRGRKSVRITNVPLWLSESS